MRGGEVGFFPPLKTSIRTIALLAVESRLYLGSRPERPAPCPTHPPVLHRKVPASADTDSLPKSPKGIFPLSTRRKNKGKIVLRGFPLCSWQLAEKDAPVPAAHLPLQHRHPRVAQR